MPQTIVTLVAEVQPRSVQALRDCIRDLNRVIESQKGTAAASYEALGASMSALHFTSIMIFEDEHYDPLLTVELNIDGDIHAFLPQLEAAGLGLYLRAMIRCCKRPTGTPGALYDGVTAPNSTQPLAPFLETRIVRPAVAHQGNRGLDCARIQREADLFDAVQTALAAPALYTATDAVGLHRDLRATMLATHPWLSTVAPDRIPKSERLLDLVRLVGFVAVLLFFLSLPGIVIGLLLPPHILNPEAVIAIVLFALAVVAVWIKLRWPDPPPPRRGLPAVPPRSPAQKLLELGALVGGLTVFVAAEALIAAVLLSPLYAFEIDDLFESGLAVFALGLACALPVVIAIVLVIRWLENRDSTQEAPPVDLDKLRAILAVEDQIAQNHMGSVVLVKPGVLRAILLRVGLTGLGLVLRVKATDGFLASMRTIHFAHWAVLNNGGRLLFFSNFDSSWESYLDDFIEKAHAGLTLAWTNGVGFPPTRFLVRDGATNGRLFKDWARHSMEVGLVWFSAYSKLSVDQIERNYRIAEGLRRASLSPEEARVWAHDL